MLLRMLLSEAADDDTTPPTDDRKSNDNTNNHDDDLFTTVNVNVNRRSSLDTPMGGTHRWDPWVGHVYGNCVILR